jgi:hypothetical protein
MHTIQLQVQDSVCNQIIASGIDIQAILDKFVVELMDDEYLRSIDGMVEGIKNAKNTPTEQAYQ